MSVDDSPPRAGGQPALSWDELIADEKLYRFAVNEAERAAKSNLPDEPRDALILAIASAAREVVKSYRFHISPDFRFPKVAEEREKRHRQLRIANEFLAALEDSGAQYHLSVARSSCLARSEDFKDPAFDEPFFKKLGSERTHADIQAVRRLIRDLSAFVESFEEDVPKMLDNQKRMKRADWRGNMSLAYGAIHVWRDTLKRPMNMGADVVFTAEFKGLFDQLRQLAGCPAISHSRCEQILRTVKASYLRAKSTA